MDDIIRLFFLAGVGGFLLYLFWPGPNPCKRCGAELDDLDYCPDLTCPHSDYQQYEAVPETWEPR